MCLASPCWGEGGSHKCIGLVLALKAPRLAGEKDEDTVTNRLECWFKLPWVPREGKPKLREATEQRPTGSWDENWGSLAGQNSSHRTVLPPWGDGKETCAEGTPQLGKSLPLNLGKGR